MMIILRCFIYSNFFFILDIFSNLYCAAYANPLIKPPAEDVSFGGLSLKWNFISFKDYSFQYPFYFDERQKTWLYEHVDNFQSNLLNISIILNGFLDVSFFYSWLPTYSYKTIYSDGDLTGSEIKEKSFRISILKRFTYIDAGISFAQSLLDLRLSRKHIGSNVYSLNFLSFLTIFSVQLRKEKTLKHHCNFLTMPCQYYLFSTINLPFYQFLQQSVSISNYNAQKSNSILIDLPDVLKHSSRSVGLIIGIGLKFND